MDGARLWDSEYLGIQTIGFSCGGYEGEFTVEGANLIRLDYKPKGVSLLHCTEDETALRTQKIYGIPLLFFPNRIKDGTFTFEGKEYHFPVNGENNTHIHGFLDGYTDWKVTKREAEDGFVNITFTHTIQEGCEMYRYFGFEIEIVYENVITSGGLYQRISFENKSGRNMPFGFAYHTTFNVPFNDSPKEAFFVRANLKSRYELLQCIPTGRLLPLDAAGENAVGQMGQMVSEAPLDTLYLADETVPNAATITDTKTGTQVVYESDSKFKHWILYNADTKQKFLSIEPQTCCTNAVNSDMETANLIVLQPGEEIALTTRLYVK